MNRRLEAGAPPFATSTHWRVAFEAAWDYATFYRRRYRVAKVDGRWQVTPA